MPAGPLLTLELQGLLFDAKSCAALFSRAVGVQGLAHFLSFVSDLKLCGKTNVGGKLEVPSLVKPLRK